MQSLDTKVVGYSLLSIGILIAFLALFNLYRILSGEAKAFSYFDFEPIAVSSEMFLGSELSNEEIAYLKQQNGGELPKIEIASSELLNDTSNYLAHLFILGSIASISTRISIVGVQLVRPIKVKLNSENDTKNKKI